MFTEIPLEATYVVKIHNAAIMSEIQPVFSFYHPDVRNGDFECSKVYLITMQSFKANRIHCQIDWNRSWLLRLFRV